MNMLTLGAAGIAAVLLAVWMKGVKAEYGIFVVIAAQLFFLFYGTGRLGEILDTVRQLEQYIKIQAGVSHNTFKNDRYYLQCRICLRDLAKTPDMPLWESRSKYLGN